jgi:hypothetical protein
MGMALDFDRNPSRAVKNRATQVQALREVEDKRAKADALHDTSNQNPTPYSIRNKVERIHMCHDFSSILLPKWYA